MENIMLGVEIFILGMVILFAALGLVVVFISVLDRLFPARRAAPQTLEPVPSEPEPQVDSQRLEEMAVAMAVAICLVEREEELVQPGLGERLEQPHGPWWSRGEART